MLKCLIVLALVAQQSDGLLDAVNSERGGRHWIDQKPDPPKSPEDSQACFKIEPGSRIELVASEPLVFDPVWIEFDHRGRMFAAEYTDYPIGPVNEDGTVDEGAAPLSKIVLLEDTNSDGRMDRRTVFADGLQFCYSFMPLMDGILAAARTEIVFLKDTDGDNVADVREVWFDGFTPAHAQMQIGCPRWGFDNWIYLTYAPGNIRCRRPGFETDEPVKMPRQDMRFDPRTMKFESVSGLGQFGNTFDNYGHRFFCTNRNPVMMEIIPQHLANQNPSVSISRRHTDVGPSGGDTKVFPLVDMKSNWLAHAGTHTSACGVTAYRGNLWNRDFHHSVFACEPVGHLVTRAIVEPQQNSPALTTRRARPDADFLASNDTWFRPASLRTGPDGALYIADMYRMWVEHPKFLPPEIAAQIDWRAGEDRGRIWRVVPEKASTSVPAFVAPKSVENLVTMLADTNGWRRQMAQQRLVEMSSPESVPQLRQLLLADDVPVQGVIHIAECLRGLDAFRPQDAVALVKPNADPAFQEHLLKLICELGEGQIVRDALLAAAESPLAACRFQAVLACGQDNRFLTDEDRRQILTTVRNSDSRDQWFQDALLVSAGSHATELLSIKKRADRGTQSLTYDSRESVFLFRVADLIGRAGNQQDVSAALKDAVWASESASWMTAPILKGLAKGMRSNKAEFIRGSLNAFLQTPPESLKSLCQHVSDLLKGLTDVAVDRSVDQPRRLAAIELLTLLPREQAETVISQVLVPEESGELQQAAVEVLRQIGGQQGSQMVLTRWNNLTPAVRSAALSLLMARTNTTAELLNSMLNGTISSSVVAIDQRVRLLQHRDESIRQLAGEVFGGVVSANRKEVADKYKPAITQKGSATRGAVVFTKTCSKCHKIDGQGHNVGPDISDTRRRSRDALLYDILDPNRRVDPQFSEYIVVTVDGRAFNGLLVSDTGDQIVLRQPEGREQTIDRSDIDEMQATSKSLMPEGIEKDVTVDQMADLLEYLKAR